MLLGADPSTAGTKVLGVVRLFDDIQAGGILGHSDMCYGACPSHLVGRDLDQLECRSLVDHLGQGVIGFNRVG